MNKETEKAAILASISEELDIWLEKKDSIRDGYEYETEFMKLAQHVNRIMLQKSLGAVPCNRKKKTSHLFRESRSEQATFIVSAH